ncbi:MULTISPECIES: glycosyltransferase family 4 protein [Olivibacter]|uniref:Glycosyltransferase family 4 protein n=1 Tax=Olivibacter jilunii TaxID=985016 RepID=A0ABW6BBD5_9SPHI|nr:glycosyltransferase family 4 protein [Olivibacter sp. UJ_SKK_5.1]MDX3912661.1 glycosyltransferase family 4 protein [Pseudosphingobacterium sp.]
MKIIQVIPSLSRGGAERFVVDLSNGLANRKGIEVILISLYDNSNEATFLRDIDARVSYFSLGKKSGVDLRIFGKLSKLVKKLQPSVIHAHLGAMEYIIPIKFSSPDIKLLFTVHNEADKECPGPQSIIKRVRKYLFTKKYIHPVVISNESARSFAQFYGIATYTLIENGSPPIQKSSDFESLRQTYQTQGYDYLLVNIARLNPPKNQGLLIEAVNYINRTQQIRLKLLIVGEVQDKTYFSQLQSLVIDDSIEFVGGKSNIGDYLSVANFFCLSSMYEGMPISLIEALSCGCIPIVTAVGGIVNMVTEGKTGFLSQGLQVENYVNALSRALAADNKEEISQQAIKTFEERFHIQGTVEKYLTLFKAKVV